MAERLRPAKYDVVGCGALCTLGKRHLGDERALLVHEWYEAGWNDDRIIREAAERGFKLTPGSCNRHRRNHLRIHVPGDAPPMVDTDGLSDVEILRLVITMGARYIPNWKLGPNEFFKAMDMYYRLTQGSAMADLFASLSAAAAGDEDSAVPAAEVDEPG